MAGSDVTAGDYSGDAVRYGKRPILHPQSCPWPRLHFRSHSSVYFFSFWILLIMNRTILQPKHIGNDVWDVAMEKRDKKIMEMLSSHSPSS
ncbi:NADH dehydrogenase [Dorcoceras hygrometricum]|uniref:NADH dehydrogenase n=1 Tax=Dorcoceras hygrometricum TaxID=472368 RepID=A0A2Z7C4M9_9LAMI|nr:NADH dehydrogenase [Dorcoceras hygrometricum]